MGDFNDIRKSDEKWGRNPQPRWLVEGFNEAIESNELRELSFEGYILTWERGRGTMNWVKQQLDRILMTDDWNEKFEEARAMSFEGPTSDHMPLAVWPIRSIRRKPRSNFRFENMWIKEKDCREVVMGALKRYAAYREIEILWTSFNRLGEDSKDEFSAKVKFPHGTDGAFSIQNGQPRSSGLWGSTKAVHQNPP